MRADFFPSVQTSSRPFTLILSVTLLSFRSDFSPSVQTSLVPFRLLSFQSDTSCRLSRDLSLRSDSFLRSKLLPFRSDFFSLVQTLPAFRSDFFPSDQSSPRPFRFRLILVRSDSDFFLSIQIHSSVQTSFPPFNLLPSVQSPFLLFGLLSLRSDFSPFVRINAFRPSLLMLRCINILSAFFAGLLSFRFGVLFPMVNVDIVASDRRTKARESLS